MLQTSLKSLSEYCERNEYQGWDLFDGLNSRIFKISPFYKSKFLRLLWIQFFKRSPVNLRVLALVPKGLNAKGLALFATGLLYQGKIKECEYLHAHLRNMVCDGYAGASWGYNFDWQARAFFVLQGIPNLVTTVFVANSFLDYFDKSGDSEALILARKACEFILTHLVLFEDEDSLCLGYIPGEETRVHNANMLGAALLSRVYVQTNENLLLDKSRKAMTYSVRALRQDFSWPYGELYHHQFIDNFHTGFNLVALYDWMKNTDEYLWQEQLKDAYRYFLDTFWLEDGSPKYYNNSLYPIDIHCSAQGILTCLKLQEINREGSEIAGRIASWAVENMQDKKGYFYYQKNRWYTNRIPYIRWAQAWMFLALSVLVADRNMIGRKSDGDNYETD